MKSVRRALVLLASTTLFLVACAVHDDTRTPGTVGGSSAALPPPPVGETLTGEPVDDPRPGARLVVVWVTDDDGRGYAYGGGGVGADGAAIVSVGGAPPPTALIGGTLGIGLIATVRDGVALPYGPTTLDETVYEGLSTRYYFIHRTEAAPYDDVRWTSLFPTGTSCARCVPHPPGELFDTLEPVDCGELQRDAFRSFEHCNWH